MPARQAGRPVAPPRKRWGCLRIVVAGVIFLLVLDAIKIATLPKAPSVQQTAQAGVTETAAPTTAAELTAQQTQVAKIETVQARPRGPLAPPSPVPTKTPIPPSPTTAPTATPAPTWTPEPPPTPQYAAVDPSTDVMVTATKFHSDMGDSFFTPKAGDIFAVVHLRIDNEGSSQVSYNELYFKLQGDDLVKYPTNFFDPTISNSRLGSGYLAPGESVAGDMAFEVPGGQRYKLLWTPTLFDSAIYVPLHN